MTRLRIVFIGKDGIYSSRPLHAIAAHHDIVGIVESHPRNYGKAPAGGLIHRLQALRERRGKGQNLRLLAQQWGAAYYLLKKSTYAGMVQFLRELQPDVVCIASMSQLMTREAFSIPRLGALNIHPTLLPLYRGPNPWYWQYHFMEKHTGVTVLKIDEGSDTGDILRQEAFDITPGMRYGELLERVSSISATLLVGAIDDLQHGRPGRVQRDQPCPFYARRLEPGHTVDWTWPIERVWHVLRGTERWVNAVPAIPGWRGELPWRVGTYVREPSGGKAGTLGKDRHGYFVRHPEGKIRMERDTSRDSGLGWIHPFLLAAALPGWVGKRLKKLF